MNTAATIVVVLIVLLIAAAIGWVVFTRWRAQRLGLPPPSIIPFRSSQPSYGVQPAPGGVTGWINDRIRTFKNRNVRTATGAYEGASGTAARGGRSGFDPDEAWDTRVGGDHDGYYEEQELGVHPAHSSAHLDASNTEYGGGATYNMNLAATPGMPPAGFGHGEDETRGRPRGRSPGLKPSTNPFDDDAEPSNISMRGVSPRPIDTAAAAKTTAARGAQKDPDSAESPTERRSIFRENM